jgi:hypothetical protein
MSGFAVEVGQGRRLLHRPVRLDELLDVASEVAVGRRVGACLVPRAWRQTGVGGLGEQASGSEVGHGGQQGGVELPQNRGGISYKE